MPRRHRALVLKGQEGSLSQERNANTQSLPVPKESPSHAREMAAHSIVQGVVGSSSVVPVPSHIPSTEPDSVRASQAKKRRNEELPNEEPNSKRQACKVETTESAIVLGPPIENPFDIGELFDLETASTGAPALTLLKTSLFCASRPLSTIEELPGRPSKGNAGLTSGRHQDLYSNHLGNTPLCPRLYSYPNVQFDERNLRLSLFLRRALPSTITAAVDRCVRAFSGALDVARIMWREREQRYYRMCSDRNNLLAYHRHINSIQRLRQWERDYDAIQDRSRPDCTPPPKLPMDAIQLHYSQTTYENWAKAYDKAMLAHFKDKPWSEYRDAKDTVWRVVNGPKPCDVPAGVWTALRQFWQHEFMAEMRKWEVVIFDLQVPLFIDLVGELYAVVMQRVEGARELYRNPRI